MKKTNLTSKWCKIFASLVIAMFINVKAFAQCGTNNFGSGYGVNVTYASQLPNSSYSGWIRISGTFVIDVLNFTFTGATVFMDNNASILVDDFMQLDIIGSDVQSCNGVDMWNTIRCTGANSRININQSTIQDGITAVWLESGAAFWISGSTFNRNYVSLNIWGGTYTATSSFLAKTHFRCVDPVTFAPANLLNPF